jgi:cytochrome bd-type quinol oxidase subunit 2
MMSISAISVLSTFVIVGFYLLALAYVISRRTERRHARRMAATALSIELLVHLGSFVFTIVLSQYGSPTSFALWYSLVSLGSALLHVFAIGLLVVAVFDPNRPRDLDGSTDQPFQTLSDDNPYASPRQ